MSDSSVLDPLSITSSGGLTNLCSRKAGRWKCRKPTLPNQKLCPKCLTRLQLQRTRRKQRGMCLTCSNPPLPRRALCGRCRARDRANRPGSGPVDVDLLADFYQRSFDPQSRCEVTGLALHDLKKLGDQLSVDRIDPTLGYTGGNMRLISLKLNMAKGIRPSVPPYAVKRLLRRLTRIRVSKLSHVSV